MSRHAARPLPGQDLVDRAHEIAIALLGRPAPDRLASLAKLKKSDPFLHNLVRVRLTELAR